MVLIRYWMEMDAIHLALPIIQTLCEAIFLILSSRKVVWSEKKYNIRSKHSKPPYILKDDQTKEFNNQWNNHFEDTRMIKKVWKRWKVLFCDVFKHSSVRAIKDGPALVSNLTPPLEPKFYVWSIHIEVSKKYLTC